MLICSVQKLKLLEQNLTYGYVLGQNEIHVKVMLT